jgi:hypothetical protein
LYVAEGRNCIQISFRKWQAEASLSLKTPILKSISFIYASSFAGNVVAANVAYLACVNAAVVTCRCCYGLFMF